MGQALALKNIATYSSYSPSSSFGYITLYFWWLVLIKYDSSGEVGHKHILPLFMFICDSWILFGMPIAI